MLAAYSADTQAPAESTGQRGLLEASRRSNPRSTYQPETTAIRPAAAPTVIIAIQVRVVEVSPNPNAAPAASAAHPERDALTETVSAATPSSVAGHSPIGAKPRPVATPAEAARPTGHHRPDHARLPRRAGGWRVAGGGRGAGGGASPTTRWMSPPWALRPGLWMRSGAGPEPPRRSC